MVPWVGLWCVIVVFPYHAHLLLAFNQINKKKNTAPYHKVLIGCKNDQTFSTHLIELRIRLYQPCDDLLTVLYIMFSCFFITFPYGDLGQVWYLNVLISDLCLLP